MGSAESIESKIGRFQQNLRAQAELYRTLLGLTRRQTQQIADSNIEQFLEVVEEKKKIITEIGEIELATAPLREFWNEHNVEADEQTRSQLRSVVNEIRALLEQLLELESQSQQILSLAKDKTEQELNHLSTGAKAMRSYRGRGECAPRFMDEKG